MAIIYCIQRPTKSIKNLLKLVKNGSNTNKAVQGRMGQY